MVAQSIANRREGRVRAAGVGFGLTLTALLLSTVFGFLVAVPIFVVGFDVESPVVLLSLLAGGQLGFFAAGYLYARRYGVAISLSKPKRHDLQYAGLGIVAALLFATGAGLLLSWVGLEPNAVLEEIVSQNPWITIWLVILTIVVVAPIEEYLFRGVIQGRLRESFSAPVAIVLASLLFGSLHLGNFAGSLGAVVGWALLITGVGVVFGILYERTNNLLVPIVAHAGYNVILFTLGYLTM